MVRHQVRKILQGLFAMKKLTVSFTTTVIFVLMCCVNSSQASSTNTWKIGHVRPAGSAIDQDLHRLADTLRKGALKNIKLVIYPESKLGDYSISQERCSFGEIEMFVGPFGTAVNKKVSLAFTPFLVTDWNQAKTTYSPGSVLLKNMSTLLEQQNIKILGGWPVYFGGIALSSLPDNVKNPDTFKKTIIRIPPIKPFELTAKALGYTPYPITWFYAKEGLKTGMVKGIIGGGAEGYLGLKKNIKYYLPLKDHFEYWFVYMNLDLWKALSADQQKSLVKAVDDMEKQRYATAEQQEAESLNALRAQGTTIISLSDSEIEAIKEKVRTVVWPEMRVEIGPMFDEVISAVNKE